jgi:UDP-N-acetyl-D-mannosaminuronic acid dehydrogenase
MTKNIVVIGMGYVGIPAAVLFADVDGFNVIGIQRRSKRSGWKIDYLNEGKNPIQGDEPGLAELIEKVVKKGTFRVTDDMSVCKDADYILFDVQTPTDEDHVPRYESLRAVSAEAAKYMKKGAVAIIESTVAPGTTDYIVKPILEDASGMKAGEDFYLAFAYERVMVGRLLYNIQNYPRIIGGVNEKSAKLAEELYKTITHAETYTTDTISAELAKVIENTYRDINIAFANEMALVAESMGANIYEVRKLVNTLPKDSNAYRNLHLPGAGVGGHCLPKDPWLLKFGLDTYGKISYTPEITVASRKLNDFMPQHMVELLKNAFDEAGVELEGSKITLLGLAFIENSDDTRNTPSVPMFNILKDQGAEVVIHDPFVRDADEFQGVVLIKDFDEAVNNADAILIVTSHKQYFDLDLNELKTKLNHPVIIDGRNVYEKIDCENAGFIYRGVGKGR